MKLGTINWWLRKIGIVLVVAIPKEEADLGIRLFFERYSTFKKRC